MTRHPGIELSGQRGYTMEQPFMRGKKKSKDACVAEWMTEGVLAVETYDSIAIARELMAKHRINQLPVVENEAVVGIVTDRDLRDAYPTSMAIGEIKKIDEFAKRYTVEEVMTHDVFTVTPDTPLRAAVALLRHHRIGALPVIESKELVGIITRSDILDFVLSGEALKPPAAARKTGEAAQRASKRPPRRRS
jgi:CBS domain-containing protein